MARDYDKEYAASRRPDRRADNVMRKRARRKMIKKHGAAAVKGKEIDHKNMNPQNNSFSNLSIMSRKANRSKQPKRK
ncbi:HNH endonuclease [Rhizobium sp. Leaf341]|uniref:HNH endonuclease n=1 Tax=Rhizobium sp. Leaf341 TaxID=1736344 RepID=UPI000A576DF1|nr:HNH endonuclease [Rhizobium sp. Leaf341]